VPGARSLHKTAMVFFFKVLSVLSAPEGPPKIFVFLDAPHSFDLKLSLSVYLGTLGSRLNYEVRIYQYALRS
jgi:hypothetical protein